MELIRSVECACAFIFAGVALVVWMMEPSEGIVVISKLSGAFLNHGLAQSRCRFFI